MFIDGEDNDTLLQYSCLENPRDGGAWWAAVQGVAKNRTRLSDLFHFSLSCIGEGNDNPLQCYCLETPSDVIPWRAAVCGVAQSRTRMKRLGSSMFIESVMLSNHLIIFRLLLLLLSTFPSIKVFSGAPLKGNGFKPTSCYYHSKFCPLYPRETLFYVFFLVVVFFF